MSWDLDGGQDKTHFTTFAPGITRIRILSDAPHQRWTHWLNKYRRSVTCPGTYVCPIDKMRKMEREAEMPYTYNSANTFAMNVYNYDAQRLEIMEQGKTFMEDLKAVMLDLKEDGKKLTDVVLKVRRTGTGREDTKYRIDVDRTEEMDDIVLDAKAKAKNLVEYFKPHTPEQIEQLIAFEGASPDDYKEEWKRVVEGGASEKNEEFQTEG